MKAVDANPAVLIAYGDKVSPAVMAAGAGRKWLYLGKEIERKKRFEKLLGSASRLRLEGRLHQVTAEIRLPFLDLVAEIGTEQSDRLGWWSSTLSWKSWGASDLFLLATYFRLVDSLIGEARAQASSLLIIVEDPWLFQQMREFWRDSTDVRLEGGVSLRGEKARALAVGLVKRIVWLFRVVRDYCRQCWNWGPKPLQAPQPPAVAIYSYPRRDCFQPLGGWKDPFLGDLDSFLAGLGYDVHRFSPPEAAGFEEPIAARRGYFHPLVLYATVSGVARSLAAMWRPRWPARLVMCGLPVQRLVEREWWSDMGRSTQCIYRFFYECLRRMLQAGEWKWCIYPYENQPWEKMISLLAREHGVRTAGIQHSTLSVNYISYFLGAGEISHMPLPDVIWSSGAYSHRMLVEGGNPPERLKMLGSIRYDHVYRRNGALDLPPARLGDVLVALPLEIYMARHLLAAIGTAFPAGGREEGVCFYVKVHPGCPIPSREWGFPAVEAPAELTEALRHCGLVLFVGSTVGPEAVALGRMAVRYRPELLLNVDTSEVFGDDIVTCTDDDLREVLLRLVSYGNVAPSEESMRKAKEELFSPFDAHLAERVFQI